MKIKFPPPGWGRGRVGVILGIFSQLREEKGMMKGRGVFQNQLKVQEDLG
jgi:hypothetical protein